MRKDYLLLVIFALLTWVIWAFVNVYQSPL